MRNKTRSFKLISNILALLMIFTLLSACSSLDVPTTDALNTGTTGGGERDYATASEGEAPDDAAYDAPKTEASGEFAMEALTASAENSATNSEHS